MLRNILGPSFDATLDQVLSKHFWHVLPFFFSKYAETTIFIVFSAKSAFLKPTPQKIETLFVHTTANWFSRFFCIFVFLGFCCVRFLGGPFWEEWKKTKFETKQQKGKKTTRCKQQNDLVLFLVPRKREKNQTTQTQNNTNQMSKMETNNTRKNKQEPKHETEKIYKTTL